ncbi:hypothetical protein F4859DRAFT_351 [Xylaria cf. heliscus]|nr:hypothetical protein F4859DRAFT_351 [Xylaria cf. heliscus]
MKRSVVFVVSLSLDCTRLSYLASNEETERTELRLERMTGVSDGADAGAGDGDCGGRRVVVVDRVTTVKLMGWMDG